MSAEQKKNMIRVTGSFTPLLPRYCSIQASFIVPILLPLIYLSLFLHSQVFCLTSSWQGVEGNGGGGKAGGQRSVSTFMKMYPSTPLDFQLWWPWPSVILFSYPFPEPHHGPFSTLRSSKPSHSFPLSSTEQPEESNHIIPLLKALQQFPGHCK